MNNSIKIYTLTIIILLVCVILQSSIIDFISINTIKPDIILILFVFISFKTGGMYGQINGFCIGLIQDFMHSSPLGFHALIYTVLGYVYSLFFGAFTADPVFLPILFIFTASLLKGLLIWILSLLFSITAVSFNYFSYQIWMEIIYSCVLAPFLLALLNQINILNIKSEGSA